MPTAHAVAVAAAVTATKEPAGALLQAVWPVRSWYRPIEQACWTVAPAVGTKKPAEAGVQGVGVSVPLAEYVPGTQLAACASPPKNQSDTARGQASGAFVRRVLLALFMTAASPRRGLRLAGV